MLALAPDIPVKQIVADLARPGLLIWRRGSKSYGDDPQRFVVLLGMLYRRLLTMAGADPESSRVTEMLMQCSATNM